MSPSASLPFPTSPHRRRRRGRDGLSFAACSTACTFICLLSQHATVTTLMVLGEDVVLSGNRQ